MGLSAIEKKIRHTARKWSRRLLDWLIELLAEPRDPSPTGHLLQPEDVLGVWQCPLTTVGLGVELRNYQVFGGKYLLKQRRVLLGDEMGLGKTIQALAAIHHLRLAGARRFLVVAPAAVIPNWINETRSCVDVPVRVMYGGDRQTAIRDWRRFGGVGVTSYETMRREKLHELLDRDATPIDFLVLDEAHYIKNPAAGRTQAARELVDRADYVAMLTGTPLENRPDEFARLLAFLDPRLAMDVREDSDGGVVGPLEFRRKVAGVYLRRNQEDVLHDLPASIERQEWVTLRRSDLRAYREAVESGNYMAMRRAVTLGDNVARSAKLARISEICRRYRKQNRKVVIFSYFLDVLEAVAEIVEPIGQITGSVPAIRREEMLERLRAEPGHAVLLCQIEAGGIGINMQAASAVVLTEPQYKPSTESQAIARVVRMGQERRVQIHRLLARDTVDEHIWASTRQKQGLFEDYARESLIRQLAECESEEDMAKFLVRFERARYARR